MSEQYYISKNHFLSVFEPEDRGKAEVLLNRIMSGDVPIEDIPKDSLFQDGTHASKYLVGLNKKLQELEILDAPFDVERIVSIADRYPQYFNKEAIELSVAQLDIETVHKETSNNVPIISDNPEIQELFALMPTGQGQHTRMFDASLSGMAGIKTDALEAYILVKSVELSDGEDSPAYQRAHTRMMVQVMQFSETARIYVEKNGDDSISMARSEVGDTMGKTLESEMLNASEVFASEIEAITDMPQHNEADVPQPMPTPSGPTQSSDIIRI